MKTQEGLKNSFQENTPLSLKHQLVFIISIGKNNSFCFLF